MDHINKTKDRYKRITKQVDDQPNGNLDRLDILSFGFPLKHGPKIFMNTHRV